MKRFTQILKTNIKLTGVVLVLGLAFAGAALVRGSSTPVAAAGSMCGKQTAPISVKHIIWIWYENEGSAAVLGNSKAPYINSVASQCGVATQMLDNGVPSLASEPNYALGTAGVNCENGTIADKNPTTGCITNDGDYTTGNHLGVPNIFQQLGTNWKSYQEGMQSNCALTNGGTLYAYKHNPADFYTNVATACKNNSIPFPAINCPTTVGGSCSGTPSGAFLNDLNAGTLPAFSFVTPNLVNDMHNNGVPPGDNWTKAWLPLITNSKAYLNGDVAVFLMWDESNGGGGSTVKIPNVVIAPSVKAGTQVSTTTNNIGFLHTAESLLGLGYVGCASGKQANGAACPAGSTSDLGSAFNLASSNGNTGGGGGGTPPATQPQTQPGTQPGTQPSSGSTPCSTTTTPATTYGVVTQTVNVPAAGTYRVWSRIKAGSSSANSYYFTTDSHCYYNMGDSTNISSSSWTWVDYKDGSTSAAVDVNLTAGTHTFKYIGREAGVELDRILLLGDLNCVPTGTGDTPSCVNSDSSKPTVSITSPSSGATINAGTTINISANASDNVGVAQVQFLVDGQAVGSPDTTPPYIYAWNTTGVSDGQHSLTAQATDTSGNTQTATAITVTVKNTNPPTDTQPGTGTPPPTDTQPGGGVGNGDVDGDGHVNFHDLGVVISHLGQNYAAADFYHDGVVGSNDLALVLTNWTN